MPTVLHNLRGQPFALLAAMDARLRATGDIQGAREWSGLMFELDEVRYVVPQAEVKEVFDLPAMTRVPGARPWLVGIANVRGGLLPIVDLRRFLGEEGAHLRADSRVVVLNDDTIPAGFLVDRVFGFRSFAPADQRHEMTDTATSAAAFLLGAFVRDGMLSQVLSLRKLAHSPAFANASV